MVLRVRAARVELRRAPLRARGDSGSGGLSCGTSLLPIPRGRNRHRGLLQRERVLNAHLRRAIRNVPVRGVPQPLREGDPRVLSGSLPGRHLPLSRLEQVGRAHPEHAPPISRAASPPNRSSDTARIYTCPPGWYIRRGYRGAMLCGLPWPTDVLEMHHFAWGLASPVTRWGGPGRTLPRAAAPPPPGIEPAPLPRPLAGSDALPPPGFPPPPGGARGHSGASLPPRCPRVTRSRSGFPGGGGLPGTLPPFGVASEGYPNPPPTGCPSEPPPPSSGTLPTPNPAPTKPPERERGCHVDGGTRCRPMPPGFPGAGSRMPGRGMRNPPPNPDNGREPQSNGREVPPWSSQ